MAIASLASLQKAQTACWVIPCCSPFQTWPMLHERVLSYFSISLPLLQTLYSSCVLNFSPFNDFRFAPTFSLPSHALRFRDAAGKRKNGGLKQMGNRGFYYKWLMKIKATKCSNRSLAVRLLSSPTILSDVIGFFFAHTVINGLRKKLLRTLRNYWLSKVLLRSDYIFLEWNLHSKTNLNQWYTHYGYLWPVAYLPPHYPCWFWLANLISRRRSKSSW